MLLLQIYKCCIRGLENLCEQWNLDILQCTDTTNFFTILIVQYLFLCFTCGATLLLVRVQSAQYQLFNACDAQALSMLPRIASSECDTSASERAAAQRRHTPAPSSSSACWRRDGAASSSQSQLHAIGIGMGSSSQLAGSSPSDSDELTVAERSYSYTRPKLHSTSVAPGNLSSGTVAIIQRTSTIN